MDESTKASNYCSETFVVLDKWINYATQEHGDKALEVVRKALQNNIKANITYYESIAKEYEKSGRKELAARNKLLANLYEGLLD